MPQHIYDKTHTNTHTHTEQYLHFNSGHYIFKLNQSNDYGKLDQLIYTVDYSFYYSFSYDSSVYCKNGLPIWNAVT